MAEPFVRFVYPLKEEAMRGFLLAVLFAAWGGSMLAKVKIPYLFDPTPGNAAALFLVSALFVAGTIATKARS